VTVRPINAAPRRPLYLEALESIRTAILSGAIRPGERLREPELARQLDLSRGPVREALRQLEREGIVESRPHLGASVVSLDGAAIEDATSIRIFLETLHLKETVRRLTDADVADLSARVQVMQAAAAAADAALLVETDFGFHERLLRISASPVMLQVWHSLAGQLRMSVALSDEIYLYEVGDVGESHRPILESLQARDVAGLRGAIREHVGQSRAILRRLLDPDQAAPPSTREEP